MGNSVFDEDLRGLNELYRDKTKINELHRFCGKKLLECYVSDGFMYFHYNMYGEVDRDAIGGWGCAYRCLQMIVSFYKLNFPDLSIEIPKIRKVQESLVLVNYIPKKKIGSRMWIEPHHSAVYVRFFLRFETREVIYYHFKTSKKKKKVEDSEKKRIGERGFSIVVSEDMDGTDLARIFLDHFKTVRSVVMVDNSIKAYIIAGIRIMGEVQEDEEELEGEEKKNNVESFQVLLFDPHVSKGFSYDSYVENKNDMESYGKGIRWVELKTFFLNTKEKRWMIFLPSRTKLILK